MYDFNNFDKLLARAGLTTRDASRVFKVSCPTIYHWRRGNAPTQQVLLAFAERMIAVIERAIVAKDFPLGAVTRDRHDYTVNRTLLINTILKKHMTPR